MDQSQAPVLEALDAFWRRGDLVFGPPGHKQGRGVDPRVLDVLGRSVFASDVLVLNGLDDRRESAEVLPRAEELMARAVRAEHAFFSTCGSSLSIRAAMMAVARPGDKLLIARNAHTSVISGVILGGIRPAWVAARLDEARRLVHPPGPEEVLRALAEHPDAKGVLLISPTDWGSCADLAGAAEVCHEHGVPLIVDEAWGAHLPFHDELPTWGMDAGADLVVTSAHKMGAAIEQSSVFHVQGERVSREMLSACRDLLGTTSASGLVYASLDGWRRQMVDHGHELLSEALARARRIRRRIAELPGWQLMGTDAIGPQAAYDIDPLRITLDVRGLGISGFQAGDWLRDRCRVAVGAADVCRIGCQISIGDDDMTETRLIEALFALHFAAADLPAPPPVRMPGADAYVAEAVVSPREAFFGPVEHVPVEQAAGRVAAEMLSPYPPGVPIVVPGEVLRADALAYLTDGLAAGMLVPDAADSQLKTLRVTARSGRGS